MPIFEELKKPLLVVGGAALILIAVVFLQRYLVDLRGPGRPASFERPENPEIFTPTVDYRSPFRYALMGKIAAIGSDGNSFTITFTSRAPEPQTKTVLRTGITRVVFWDLKPPRDVDRLMTDYLRSQASSAPLPFPEIYASEEPMQWSELKAGDDVAVLSNEPVSDFSEVRADLVAKIILPRPPSGTTPQADQ